MIGAERNYPHCCRTRSQSDAYNSPMGYANSPTGYGDPDAVSWMLAKIAPAALLPSRASQIVPSGQMLNPVSASAVLVVNSTGPHSRASSF